MPPFKDLFDKKCVLIILVVAIISASVIAIAWIHRPQPTEPQPNAKLSQAPVPTIRLNEAEILKCMMDAGFKKSRNHTYYSHVATCRDLAQLTNSLLERYKELPKWSKVDRRKALLIDDYEWMNATLLMEKIESASQHLCQGSPEPTKQPTLPPSVKTPLYPTSGNQIKSTTTKPLQPPTTQVSVNIVTTSTKQPRESVTPATVAISTPPKVATSTPPKVATSTPPKVATSTPPKVATSTPPKVATSTPPKVATSTPPKVTTSIPPKLPSESQIFQHLKDANYEISPDQTSYTHVSTCEDLVELLKWLTQEEKEIPPLARFMKPKVVRIDDYEWKNGTFLVQKIKTVRDIVCQNTSDILTVLSKYKFEIKGTHLYEARLNCSDFAELWEYLYERNKTISFSSHTRNEAWMVFHQLELLNTSQLIKRLEWVSGKLCQPLPNNIWQILEQEGFQVLNGSVLDLNTKDCSKLAKLINTIPKKSSKMIPDFVQENSDKLVQILKTTHAQQCEPQLNDADVLNILKESNFTASQGNTYYNPTASCRDLSTIIKKLRREYGDLPEWSDIVEERDITIDDYEYERSALLIDKLENAGLRLCQTEPNFLQHHNTSVFKPTDHGTYEADVSCHSLAKLWHDVDRTIKDLPDWSKVNKTTRMAVVEIERSNKTRLIQILRWMSNELCKDTSTFSTTILPWSTTHSEAQEHPEREFTTPRSMTPPESTELLEAAHFQLNESITGTYIKNNASCNDFAQLWKNLTNSNESLPKWSTIKKWRKMVVQDFEWGTPDLLIHKIETAAQSLCKKELDFWEILIAAGFKNKSSFFEANLTCSDFNKLFHNLKELQIGSIAKLYTADEPKRTWLYFWEWKNETIARERLKSIANEYCKTPLQPTSEHQTKSTTTKPLQTLPNPASNNDTAKNIPPLKNSSVSAGIRSSITPKVATSTLPKVTTSTRPEDTSPLPTTSVSPKTDHLKRRKRSVREVTAPDIMPRHSNSVTPTKLPSNTDQHRKFR